MTFPFTLSVRTSLGERKTDDVNHGYPGHDGGSGQLRSEAQELGERGQGEASFATTRVQYGRSTAHAREFYFFFPPTGARENRMCNDMSQVASTTTPRPVPFRGDARLRPPRERRMYYVGRLLSRAAYLLTPPRPAPLLLCIIVRSAAVSLSSCAQRGVLRVLCCSRL